jgi:hypothetical protein
MRLISEVGVLALVLAGCVGQSSPTLPFAISSDSQSVLADWRTAGFSCDQPTVGEPGPAVDWSCRGRLDGVDLAVSFIADRHGPQSIVVAPKAGTDRTLAAPALADLASATSFLGDARRQIAAWLRANAGADGTMPLPSPVTVGRVAVDTEQGLPTLYIVPVGSSIMLAPQPKPSG